MKMYNIITLTEEPNPLTDIQLNWNKTKKISAQNILLF